MSDTSAAGAAPEGPEDVASMEDILSSIRSMIAEEATEPVITQYEVTSNIGTEVARARSAVRDQIREGTGHLHRNDPIPVIPADIPAPVPDVPMPDVPVPDVPLAQAAPPIVDMPPIAVEAADPSVDLVSGNDAGLSDIFADLDLTSGDAPMDIGAPAETNTETEAVADVVTEDFTEDFGDFEIESLLGGLAPEMPAMDVPDATGLESIAPAMPDPVLESLADDAPAVPTTVDFAETEDMDLVKSLMAELTDAPAVEEVALEGGLMDDLVTADTAEADTLRPDTLGADTSETDGGLVLDEDWLESELAIPELDAPEPAATPTGPQEMLDDMLADTPDPMDSIFDEIVEQAIVDEEALDSADLDLIEALPEQDAIDLADLSSGAAAAPIAAVAGGATVISLADIARRADADADALANDRFAVTRDLQSARTAPPVAEPVAEDIEPAVPDAASLSQEGMPVEPVETLTDMDALEDEYESESAYEDDDALDAFELENAELEDAELEDTEPEDSDEDREDLETDDMARNAPLEEIITDDVEMEASSAFAELNRLVEEKTTFEERGPRIGDLVQEALKPMLKEWLDENLKAIVERAVTKEVKRISSGK